MSNTPEIQALRNELEQMRQRLRTLESDRTEHRVEPQASAAPSADTPMGRRRWMKTAAGAAVGGTAALLAAPAGRAAAANGDALLIGNRAGAGASQVASGATQLNYTGTEDIGFVVQSGTSFSAESSSIDAALAGWTSRSVNPVGVYGFSSSAVGAGSVGVVGRTQSSNGIGVQGLGVASGANGVSGSTTSSSGSGVYGEGATAMRAIGTQIGIVASGGTSGVGVAARGRDAVQAEGTRFGVTAFGTTAALQIRANGTTAPPDLADTHGPGEIRLNQTTGITTGELWVCVEAGDPGIWRRVAGPSTAGAFTAIDPARAYDSRSPTPFRQVLAGGQDRVVSIADGRDLDTGVVAVADVVPAGATAIAYNITVTNTTGAGFLAVAPGGAAAFGAAAVNWGAPGTTVGNAGIVKLDDARQVKIFAGGGTTDFIIDITGFFL